jgi:hypothetical protein
MKTDTEIKCEGVQALIANLGKVDAERFVAILSREPFDYTLWQRDLWPEKTAREISALAMSFND